MTKLIKIAETDEEIASCFFVMAELRPHITTEEEFIRRVRRQFVAGYKLVFLEEKNEVRALAGFRVTEGLAWGKFMYVDDLVTNSSERSKGYGKALFDWLVAYASANGCAELHLNSGVQRFDAHRFYLRNRMEISCHHFAMKLEG